MRKLMWFTVGAVAICAAGIYLVSGAWLLRIALFCLLGGVAFAFGKSVRMHIAAVVLFGCVAGAIWMYGYDQLYLRDARSFDGQTVSAEIMLTDYSYETSYTMAADGEVFLSGKTYRVRVYLPQAEPLSPGDRVKGEFRFQFTAGGGEKEPTYHQGKGIFLLAYCQGEPTISRSENVPLQLLGARLRRSITDMLDRVFPQDTLAFARALLLGDSSLLTYEEETAFRTSGIRHVIAVSGLHVSILFSLVFVLCGKRRFLTAFIGLPVLLLFAAVAGFTPSINRACIMQGLMILALLCNKEYDPPTALAFAVIVMLAVNPMTITSVSFQLSVGCLIGIFLFSERLSDYLLRKLGSPKGKGLEARLCRWFAGSLSVTLSAMSVTTPLCAIYFESISLIGILTNLVTLWVISFIFYGIMIACVAGAIWLPAGSVVAWVISWPIRYVLIAVKLLGSLPFAAVYTCSVYIVAWLVFSYVLFAVFLHLKKKRPLLFGGCILVTLCLCLFASWLEPKLDRYRVTVLDVGQGQCVLLQYDGKNFLVDCGGDTDRIAADTAAQYLLSQGITRLDGAILTHFDRDHAGGLMLLMSRIPADTLYLPDAPDDGGIKQQLTQGYKDRICWISPDTVLTVNEMAITAFAAESGKTENESSLCILFQPEDCDILITGDRSIAGEKALLEQTSLPELEVLIVGHHGSGSSTGLLLLAETKPQVAVISVGKNIYGLPSQQVLELLEMFGSVVMRTDLDGTIVFRG